MDTNILMYILRQKKTSQSEVFKTLNVFMQFYDDATLQTNRMKLILLMS